MREVRLRSGLRVAPWFPGSWWSSVCREDFIMNKFNRLFICGAILADGMAAQSALGALNRTERPALRMPLASIPLELGNWSGRDEPVDADIIERAQTTEYINRTHESRKHAGLRLRLWINYSRQ